MKQLFYMFNVKTTDLTDFQKNINPAKFKKELCGERLLTYKHIWNHYFPGKRPVKITDREMQKSGIDFIVDGLNIDLKVNVGDYKHNGEDLVVIELLQDGVRTITKDKKTDYILFININTNDDTYVSALVPYSRVLEIVDVNMNNEKDNKFYCSARDFSESDCPGYYMVYPLNKIESYLATNGKLL